MAGNRDTPRPYRPDDGVTLVGPFWTRTQVAGLLGTLPAAVAADRTLLRIDGRLSVEEVYPAFQFDGRGMRREVAFLARLLKRRVLDVEACDWLRRPRRAIDGRTPMDWLAMDGDVDRVMRILPAPSRPIPGSESDDGGPIEAGATPTVDDRERRRWSPTPVAH